MKRNYGVLLFAVAAAVGVFAPELSALAQQASVTPSLTNTIQALEVGENGGKIYVRIKTQKPLSVLPTNFSTAKPPRIAFDFVGAGNGLGRESQTIERGDLRSASIIEVGDRTRVVLNLARASAYQVSRDGTNFVIALTPVAGENGTTSPAAQSAATLARATTAATNGRSLSDINFRRGNGGEGRVVVQLSNPDVGIDVRQQGGKLIVHFLKASLPDNLRRQSDVTDFGTPVSGFLAEQQGDNVRLTVQPNGLWEHNAYQSGNQFVLEVKRVVEDPDKLVQRSGRLKYRGDKLSLNFQNVDVRSVLQVIADFTDFNIVTSDSVQGDLTLRLKDVPWDQALDIILQAKGLDMRKSGNVIWIAPGEELASREKMINEARAQVEELEPVQTESFQINYHKGKEINDFLQAKGQTVLSKRGSVVVDDRSNKVFVTDIGSRLAEVRRVISEIDVPPRQVLIEARIVEASKTFTRDLGVRMGIGEMGTHSLGNAGQLGFGHTQFGTYSPDGSFSAMDTSADSWSANGIAPLPWPSNKGEGFGGNTAAPIRSGTGIASPFGTLDLTIINNKFTRFLNIAIEAQETDGKARTISSPRVLTANNVEALIEQGKEIPYQEASSSGATTVSFKKAVLSLKVKPQITPDGRLQLTIEVNKDNARMDESVRGVPPIETKSVKSEVLIENGGTVVIGGIYLEEDSTKVTKVPLLGDLPVLGHLFRTTNKTTDQRELLVFVTPRVVDEDLTLR